MTGKANVTAQLKIPHQSVGRIRIRISIKVTSSIRIRIKVKSRIRIRIKVTRRIESATLAVYLFLKLDLFIKFKIIRTSSCNRITLTSKCTGSSDLFGKPRRCVDIPGVLEEVVGLHVD
jgi:hypothetical protein